MLRSATLDTLISNCTHVEQILDLCARALYDRYYPSAFITTGLSQADEAIRSLRINHWTGNQIVGENLIEEQTRQTLKLRPKLRRKRKLKQIPRLKLRQRLNLRQGLAVHQILNHNRHRKQDRL